MPSKIDTDNIVRERNDRLRENVEASNADYVTRLEETTTLMPPEQPFEKESAKQQTKNKEQDAIHQETEFSQKMKESVYNIERLDQSYETKLHLLNLEHGKISKKLEDGSMSKKELSRLEDALHRVEDRIELYMSKLNAGAMSTPGKKEELEGEGDGEGDGEGGGILDGLKEKIMSTGAIILAGKKRDEEEEEEEEEEGPKKA